MAIDTAIELLYTTTMRTAENAALATIPATSAPTDTPINDYATASQIALDGQRSPESRGFAAGQIHHTALGYTYTTRCPYDRRTTAAKTWQAAFTRGQIYSRTVGRPLGGR